MKVINIHHHHQQSSLSPMSSPSSPSSSSEAGWGLSGNVQTGRRISKASSETSPKVPPPLPPATRCHWDHSSSINEKQERREIHTLAEGEREAAGAGIETRPRVRWEGRRMRVFPSHHHHHQQQKHTRRATQINQPTNRPVNQSHVEKKSCTSTRKNRNQHSYMYTDLDQHIDTQVKSHSKSLQRQLNENGKEKVDGEEKDKEENTACVAGLIISLSQINSTPFQIYNWLNLLANLK